MLKDFTKMRFDIIVAAGQSNCLGAGLGDVEFPYKPKDSIMALNPDFTISKATERIKGNSLRGSFPLYFADLYLENGYLKDDRFILIIKSASGGTGFAKKHWGKGDEFSLRMFEMVETALSLNPENKVVAFLWHQGEHDVSNNTPPLKQLEYLRILLQDIKNEIGTNFPLIAGDFVHDFKLNKIGDANGISGTIKIAFSEIDGYFVETDGLKSNNEVLKNNHEIVHFSRECLPELAKRYFEKFELSTRKR